MPLLVNRLHPHATSIDPLSPRGTPRATMVSCRAARPNRVRRLGSCCYLGGKKRRELGIVYAVDQAAAEAAWVLKISEARRNRIVVEPE
jgi:hypothetical protein